jgi:hypothetical protein
MSHRMPILAVMGEASRKIVSIETFRAAKLVDGTTTLGHRESIGVRPDLSRRSIEHRERMLRYLMTAAAERAGRTARPEHPETREVQGRLLL